MPAAKRLEYGGHALVWAGDWSAKGAATAISGAARAGYDYIEIALLDPPVELNVPPLILNFDDTK